MKYKHFGVMLDLRDNPRARLRLTACFLSAAINSNSLASPPSRFPQKSQSDNLSTAAQKRGFACGRDYNLPPSVREVSRQSRDGGSSCPPCAREGGAAKLRRKGCLAIIRCKRRHCVMPFHLGGTKVVCRLGHEIAAEMAIS